MNIDIRKIAQDLITELLKDANASRERAIGVQMYFDAIVREGEKLNGREAEHSESGAQASAEEQAPSQEAVLD